VRESVSLVDLLPTLVDLAQEGAAPSAAFPLSPELEGRSLLPHLRREGGHDEAFAEYLAEGALAPIVMIRRGHYKFIHSPADPDLMFDLVADPDELQNLASDATQAERLRDFRAEVAQRWNLPELHTRVLESQRRRRFLHSAESLGQRASWDFQPYSDASHQYVRSHLDLDVIEAMARYPAYR
jgi:choline-sulfatase